MTSLAYKGSIGRLQVMANICRGEKSPLNQPIHTDETKQVVHSSKFWSSKVHKMLYISSRWGTFKGYHKIMAITQKFFLPLERFRWNWVGDIIHHTSRH